MDMEFAVDAVLDGVEHLSQTLAMAKRLTNESIDPLMLASATMIAWNAAVHTSAPADVAVSVAEAAAELTAILVNGVRDRAQQEGEAFKSFGLD